MRINCTSFFNTYFIGLILIGLLLLLLQPFPAGGADLPSSITSCQFLYIDANVGGSSGGHSALRIDNNVYHFQYYPDGIFRLIREPWTYFRYIYNDLENRSIHIAHIQLDPEDKAAIKEHFDRFHLIQSAYLERLQTLIDDTKLIHDLASKSRQISISGAGLFAFRKAPDKTSSRVRSIIVDAYGSDYLERNLKILDQEIVKLPATVIRLEKNIRVTNQSYPEAISSLTKSYRENRLKRTALQVLNQSLPVDRDELISLDDWSWTDDKKGLTENERLKLEAYTKLLQLSVLHLPSSNRPDWGYPLLLATARLQAVRLSLAENRLLLLDPFPEPAIQTEPKSKDGEGLSITAKLAERTHRTYQNVRWKIFAAPALNERAYNLLEESAGRFVELERGHLSGRPIRVAYGRLIPSRTTNVDLPGPVITPEKIKETLAAARFNQKLYHNKLKNCYPYNLVTRNCATELIRTLNAAFKNEAEISRALGGTIIPVSDLSFVPFALFDLVTKRFRVAEVEIMPGFRKRMLARMRQRENRKTALYFRECNTLTSTIYQPVVDDTPFIFFTDDIILPRPLYGISNAVYGLLSSAVGIFTLPFDRGQRSLKGLKGTLYSLPEIFFFNIRKGSFDYVDDFSDPESKTLEKSTPAFNRRVSP
jgi:hypothetical protein